MKKIVGLAKLSILASIVLAAPFVGDGLEESFSTLLLVLSCGVLLFLQVVSGKIKPYIGIYLAFSLLIIWFLVATLLSPVVYTSVLVTLRWLSLAFIFVFLINFLTTRRRQYLITHLILAVGVLTTLDAFFSFLVSDVPIAQRYMYGPLNSYNWWGGLLLYFLPLSFTAGIFAPTRSKKAGYGLLSILFMTALLLTRSRAAWLGAVVGLGLVFFFLVLGFVSSRRNKTEGSSALLKFAGLFFVIVLVSTLAVTSLFGSRKALFGRFTGSFDISQPEVAASSQAGVSFDTSWIHRKDLWKNSLRMIQDRPVFGIGPGNFGRVYHQYQSQAWVFATDPHNTYFSLATETGVVGLLLFLVLCLAVLWSGRGKLKKTAESPTGNSTTIGVAAVIISVLTYMFLDHGFGALSSQIYFFIFLAVFVAVSDDGKQPVTVVSKLVRSALVGLGLLALSVSFVFFRAVRFFQQAEQVESPYEQLALYDLSSKLNPFQAFVFERRGLLFLRTGNPDDAKDNLERSIALDPTIPETYGQLAIVHYNLKDFDKAELYLQRAIEAGPYTTPRYYNALAKFYTEQGDSQRAFEVYQSAREHFPMNDIFKAYHYLYYRMDKELAETYTNLAENYRSRGEPDKADGVMAEVIDGLSVQ